MQKECVVHIDSLTRHPPGCQSAVSYSILASLLLSGSIDPLARLNQHYMMETRKPIQSKKAVKYLLEVGVKRGQKCRICEQQGPGKKINGQENRIVP